MVENGLKRIPGDMDGLKTFIFIYIFSFHFLSLVFSVPSYFLMTQQEGRENILFRKERGERMDFEVCCFTLGNGNPHITSAR